MPQHTSTSMNSALIRTTYWTDTHGTSRHFAPVRTQIDVVRELHYKTGNLLLRNVKRYLAALRRVGLAQDLDGLTLSEDTKSFIDAYGINSIEAIMSDGTYQVEICGVGGQWRADALPFLERLQQELWTMMPDADGAARQVAEAHKKAAKTVEDVCKSVAQIKERLIEADKMVVSLEKVIAKANLTMPDQCMCGEIRSKEDETEVLKIPARKVLVLGQTADGKDAMYEDYEGMSDDTYEHTVELSRPTWFGHNGTEEDGMCRNCVLGDTSKKGKCSPCFDPNPKKCPAVIGTQYGKAFEFYAPQCPVCVNPLSKSNCFAWNKNRYLVCPQLGECLKELIPKRQLRNGEYDSVLPSAVKEVSADSEIPVQLVRCSSLGSTNYWGNYEYATGTSYPVVVRGVTVIDADAN